MNSRLWFRWTLMLGMVLPVFGLLTESMGGDPVRPNIIVILSDDMGYSDLGCYGGEIQTPHLDALAAKGLRFTQFYNTARCCPTRASLLTGLYPHQAGVGWMMNDQKLPGYRGDLSQSCATMAEMLKPAGYSTYMTGKWHVTPHVRPGSSQVNWPLQRGFDRFYGTIHGAGSFFDPNALTRDNTLISPFADPEYQPETYYYTDAITDHAARFIDEHVHNPQGRAPGPFFLYVAYTAAHWPMHALPEDIAKYSGKYAGGYGPAREQRQKKMQELGLIDPSWKLTAQADEWEKVPDKEWETRGMEVYAAMVDRMDQGIGRIVSKLRETGQLDNTLILFMQDNGGCAEPMGRGNKLVQRADGPTLPPMAADALQLDMVPKQTRDGYPVLQGRGVMPGPADTYLGYGRGWANVSNTPFREYKHWVHEGGISTPLIAFWPNGIARHGELETTPGHLIDIAATCVDLGKVGPIKKVKPDQAFPLAGVSLSPLFRGEKISREAIYWEHEGNRAVRMGDWKLVAKENRPWELYDMRADRTETHDLAAQHPERVKEMEAAWMAWAEHSQVLPLGAWRGKSNDATPKKEGNNTPDNNKAGNKKFGNKKAETPNSP
ncbi:MAG: arylsulfatase [Planctomycetaceae bacterium]